MKDKTEEPRDFDMVDKKQMEIYSYWFNKGVEFGKQEQKREAVELIEKWFNDSNTCSGKPHCSVENCDLCINCYIKLLNKLGYTWENGMLKEIK